MKTNTAFLSLFFVAISTFFAAQARAQMPPDVSFLNYGGLQGAMLPPYGGVQSQLQLSMQGQYAMPGFDQPSVPQILGGSNYSNLQMFNSQSGPSQDPDIASMLSQLQQLKMQTQFQQFRNQSVQAPLDWRSQQVPQANYLGAVGGFQ